MPTITAPAKTARVVAALLTASSPMAGSFSASAQQMRLGATATAADVARACAHLKAPAANAQCQHDAFETIAKAGLEAANKRVAAANNEVAAANVRMAEIERREPCLEYLKQQKAAGKPMARPVTKDNLCAVAEEMGMSPR